MRNIDEHQHKACNSWRNRRGLFRYAIHFEVLVMLLPPLVALPIEAGFQFFQVSV
jgi:hypothetical protein